MATAKLTKRLVDEAKHPGTSDGRADPRSMFLIYDTDIKGFALKVTPAGGKMFVVDWRQPGGSKAPKGRTTIGTYGSPYTVEMAREVARDVLAKVRQGINPNQSRKDDARRAVDLAFNKVAERFIETYAKQHQPRTYGQARRTLDKDIISVFGSRPLHNITRADVSALLHDHAARAPQQSRYTHATLRKLFRWAVETGQLDQSPMSAMSAPAKAVTRDRVLSDDELAEIWRAIDTLGDPFATIYRLLIATGQRREEVGGMTWAEIDLANATWTIPAERAKNGKAHVVPLNSLAMGALEGLANAAWRGRDESAELIFSSNGKSVPQGWSKAKARCDAVILANRIADAQKAGQPIERVKPMPSWRAHDFRRTMATGFQRLGIRLEVTEAALNHVSGSRGGIVGVYQRHDWADEKRMAMAAWAAHIGKVIGEDPGDDASKVIPMERRAAG
jgi:integrase